MINNILITTFLPLAFTSIIAILASVTSLYVDEITPKTCKKIIITSVLVLIASLIILTIIL